MARKGHCDRCGQCCLQGGPALHTQDLELIKEGHILRDDLVTVRKGELALAPLQDTPQAVEKEFLKLQGHQGQWSCIHYDMAQGLCRVYRHRPLACRVLECIAPEPLLAITGKNLLSRFDLIPVDDPLLPYVREHEARCPCPPFSDILEKLSSATDQDFGLLEELEQQVQTDIRYRTALQRNFGMTLGRELFYLGRPLFQLLVPLGLATYQEGERVRLYRASPSAVCI
ncbi:MAG: hypothetical protein CSA33_04200 [Desulfobulbus propionicus]|nr:MAG: hypothetical protein CSA33_04200 [Desulfobulbus propionicus]